MSKAYSEMTDGEKLADLIVYWQRQLATDEAALEALKKKISGTKVALKFLEKMTPEQYARGAFDSWLDQRKGQQ